MTNSRSLARVALCLALAGLAGLAPVRTADAATRKLGNAGSSSALGGQRNVVAVPGWGYWVFYKEVNSDRPAWRFSADGQNWTAAQDIFPFLQTAPNAAAGEPSVWYVDDLKRVYVAAGDAGPDIAGSAPGGDFEKTDTGGNIIFLRYGTLTSGGSITWDTGVGIRRQKANIRVATSFCHYSSNDHSTTVWDVMGGGKPATVVYSSSTLGSYVAVAANTDNSLATANNMGAIVVTNIKSDLTDYATGSTPNVFVFCNESDGAAGGQNAPETANSQGGDPGVLNPAGLAMVPALEGTGSAHFILGARLQNLDPDAAVPLTSQGKGALIRLSSTSVNETSLNGSDGGGGTGNTVITGTMLSMINTVHAYNPNDNASVNVDGFSFAGIHEQGSPTAHFAYIDNNGSVAYNRKTSSSTVLVTPITLAAATTGAFPLQNPAMTFLYNAYGQVPAFNDVYTLWTSTGNDTLYYKACRSTFTVTTTPACDATKVFRNGTGMDNIKPGFHATYPSPIPVIWTEASGTYFDKIITSTFPVAVVTSVTEAPTNGYLNSPTYDLNVNAAGTFERPGAVNPSFFVLKSSETNVEITVTSVTWVSKSNIRASIRLSTYVTAGFAYDLRYTQADGQEYPIKYDRNSGPGSDVPLSYTIPAPTITSVADFDTTPNAAFVSGGGVLATNTNGNLSRSIRLAGTNFMNWSGLTNVSQLQSTNTVRINFRNSITGVDEPEISIASITYQSNTRLNAFVRISSAVAGGRYEIVLANPASGYALSQASTFYVTVPTATLTVPGPGTITGFTLLAGTVGFNNSGQTTISNAQVRITHASSGKRWNGGIMTTAVSDEEAQWIDATLSPSATAYWYTPPNINSDSETDDGIYEIAARAWTSDGGRGDPYEPGFISTHSITLDRFAPTVSLLFPTTGALNAASHVNYTVSDLGTGVTTTQLLIQDIGIPAGAPSTWVSFTTAGVLGYAGQGQIWMSTTTGNGTPVTIFGGAVGTSNIDITAATTIKVPQWQDGHQYRVSIWAQDQVPGHTVDTSTGSPGTLQNNTYKDFIYDITGPTITVTSPAGMTGSSGTAVWVTNFNSITGTVKDNVASSADQERIFIRVVQLQLGAAAETPEKWIDPNTGLFTNSSVALADAWKEMPAITMSAPDATDPWPQAYDLSTVAKLDGYTYRVEVYARDGAGNSTGTAVSPAFRGYLRLDASIPTVASLRISTGTGSDNGAVIIATDSSVGLYNSTNPLTSIRLSLNDKDAAGNTGSGIASVQYYLRFDGSSGQYNYDRTNPSSWTFQTITPNNPIWWNATSTTTPAFQVALTSAVPWINSQQYYIA